VRHKNKSTSQKQTYVAKAAYAPYKSLLKNLSFQSSMSMLFMDTNGVQQTKYTVFKLFLHAYQPFLIHQRALLPSSVNSKCRRLTIPGILLNRLPVSCGDIGFFKSGLWVPLLLPSANNSAE
jgi:hypothetical protein